MATILPYAGIHPRIHPTAFVAPTAVVIGNVTIGREASVWFGAVLRGDEPEFEIRVGERTSVQDNVVIHVSRAVVLQRATVGEAALIAAGAVVGSGTEIPPRTMAAGTPAKVKKELDGESLRWVTTSADHYVELSRSYLAAGVGRMESPEAPEGAR